MLDALAVGLMGVVLIGYGTYALRQPGSSMFRPTSALHSDEDTRPTGRAIGSLAVGLGVAGLIGAVLLAL